MKEASRRGLSPLRLHRAWGAPDTAQAIAELLENPAAPTARRYEQLAAASCKPENSPRAESPTDLVPHPKATTTNRPFASRVLNRTVGAWAKSAGHCSWGVAPGWNDNGPLALNRTIATMQVIEEFTAAGVKRQRCGTCQPRATPWAYVIVSSSPERAEQPLSRPFRAWVASLHCSWGVAPGWNDNGPLALNPAISTKCVASNPRASPLSC